MCLCVSVEVREGESRCVCVFVCGLEHSRGTWLMLWTRLRDSLSVALLPPPCEPQTHAGTYTTSFPLSFFSPLSSFSFLSQIIIFYQTDFFLQRHCCIILHVLLSIYYMLSNCCLVLQPSPPFIYSSCRRSIDPLFSECHLQHYPTM